MYLGKAERIEDHRLGLHVPHRGPRLIVPSKLEAITEEAYGMSLNELTSSVSACMHDGPSPECRDPYIVDALGTILRTTHQHIL